MTTHLTGLRSFAATAFLALALQLNPSSLFAQASQYYHSRGIFLDDGAGHTTTLLPTGTYGTFAPAYVNAYLPYLFAPYIAPVGFYIFTPFTTQKVGFTINAAGDAVAGVTGIYTADFSVTPQSATSFALYQNGVKVAASQVDCAANATTHGSTILSLTAGDVITIINTGGSSATLSPANVGSNLATLNIVRIQ
jgi:hypothetical protein